MIEPPAGTFLFCSDSRMKRYALRLHSGTILVRRVDDDQEVGRFQAGGDREHLRVCLQPGRPLPDDDPRSRISLTVWDVDRNMIVVADQGPVRGTTARFSPDSRRIALAHPDGEILIYDLETGRPRRLRSGLQGYETWRFARTASRSPSRIMT